MFTNSKAEAININIIPHSLHNQTEKKKQIKEYTVQMRQEIPQPVPIRTEVMLKTSKKTLVTKKDPSCQLWNAFVEEYLPST